MSSRSFHDAPESYVRDLFINTLLLLRGNDRPEQIGYVSRCLAMIAHRSRLVPNLIMSFCSAQDVYGRRIRIESVVESVPLMTHLSDKAKQDLLWMMFRQFRGPRAINGALTEVFIESMAAISREESEKMKLQPSVSDDLLLTIARALSSTEPS